MKISQDKILVFEQVEVCSERNQPHTINKYRKTGIFWIKWGKSFWKTEHFEKYVSYIYNEAAIYCLKYTEI